MRDWITPHVHPSGTSDIARTDVQVFPGTSFPLVNHFIVFYLSASSGPVNQYIGRKTGIQWFGDVLVMKQTRRTDGTVIHMNVRDGALVDLIIKM
jgi:hypothetical protein